MKAKAEIQEAQYSFPYHHLTHEDNGSIFIFRHLFWGLVHYTYIMYVIEQICAHQFTSLADIGCGEGRIIMELEKKNPSASLQGYDISERAIQFAKAFSHTSKFKVHDITKAPLVEKVDFIVSCEVIEHIAPEEVQQYIDNIHASLKPGGKILFTTPTTNTPVIPKHYQHFTAAMFDTLLAGKFTDIHYSYLNRDNWYSKLLERLLSNRFFISNMKTLNRLVLSLYRKHLLISDARRGTRIVVTATKLCRT